MMISVDSSNDWVVSSFGSNDDIDAWADGSFDWVDDFFDAPIVWDVAFELSDSSEFWGIDHDILVYGTDVSLINSEFKDVDPVAWTIDSFERIVDSVYE